MNSRKGKQIITLILLAVLVMTLGACGRQQVQDEDPARTVAALLEDIKDGEYTKLIELCDVDGREAISVLQKIQSLSGDLTESQKKTVEEFTDMATQFRYDVDDADVDGDTAEVPVTFTTYDYKKILKQSTEGLSGKILPKLLKGESPNSIAADLAAMFLNQLAPALEEAKEEGQTRETVVSLSLTRQDGEWELDKLTRDDLDSICGGMTDGLGDLGSLLDKVIGE